MITKDEENDLVKYEMITYNKSNKTYKMYIGYVTRYS